VKKLAQQNEMMKKVSEFIINY